MSSVAGFSPAVAREILDTVRWVRQVLMQPGGRTDNLGVGGSSAATARNDSGAEIPAFGLVQLVGADAVGALPVGVMDSPADVMGASGPFAVVGTRAVPDGASSPLQHAAVLRILTDGSTLTFGDRWGPDVGEHHLVPDDFGPFVAVGADQIDDVGLFVHVGPVTLRRARVDSTITSGSSGTVSVYVGTTDSGTNVTAWWNWATDGEDIEAGTDVWIRWAAESNRWEIAGGACGP